MSLTKYACCGLSSYRKGLYQQVIERFTAIKSLTEFDRLVLQSLV
jgi:hypothetical protein